MDKAEEKREAKLQEELDGEYTLKFKKRQWIVIYNLLVSDGRNPRLYSLGDAKVVNEICDQIQTIAAIKTEPEPKPEEGVVVN